MLFIIQIGDIVEILIAHALHVTSMTADIFNLIQSFLNDHNSRFYSGLEKFWTKSLSPDEARTFNQTIINTLRTLLNSLTKDVNTIDENVKRLNLIRAKLCLMIYVHPAYQSVMREQQYQKMGQDIQQEIVKIFLQIFFNRAAYFISNDGHLVQMLYTFMNFRKNVSENGKHISDILMYVNAVFSCC